MSGWTDERTDTLKKLWSQGLSASQIAKELGGVTRNGVIGKVHRLGLSGTGSFSHATASKPKPKGVMVLEPLKGGATEPKRMANIIANAEARIEPSADFLARAKAFTPAPDSVVVPFGAPGYKWPVRGEGADMLCCGRTRDSDLPYCEEHAAVAYQPTPPKRSANELARSLRKYV